MRSVGLITEYNPFHNGHLYHIENSKRITEADTVVSVMSGSFVQRGEPAVIDKYSRTAMALAHGVNLLVELPTVYACSSAENFSYGGIMTLERLGVDAVCFGSECGDVNILSYIAELLLNETPKLSSIIKDKLASGLSYPKARNDALCEYITDFESIYSRQIIEQVLSSPNNILGIEYIKTIKKYNLSIVPYTIKRIGSDYHETQLITSVPSASAIRNIFQKAEASSNESLINAMPEDVYTTLRASVGRNFPICIDDFSVMLTTKLQYLIHADYTRLTDYLDVNIDFANKILNVFTGFETFTQLIEKLKSKQLTYTRVCRSLLHILLEITDENAFKYNAADTVPYIRLLGFDEVGQVFLNAAKKKCEVPIITKTAGYKDLLREDLFASELYNTAVFNKFNTKLTSEYRQGPIRYVR